MTEEAKKDYQLEFYAKEYMGMEVYHDLPDPVNSDDLKPIKEKDAIKPADRWSTSDASMLLTVPSQLASPGR